jgi:hypothetical protein
VVWRGHSIDVDGIAGTDVFDLSCPNAQRLFSTVKKTNRESPQINADKISFYSRSSA